jgi:dTDP-4-dehydrorhamnose reductase
MDKILVTGANGQLGSEIKFLARDYPYNFIFTDVKELDIADENGVQTFFEKNSFEIIINCAAYTAVDLAESNPETAYQINHKAIGLLASLAKRERLKMIHISTDYVFDGKGYRPYSVDSPTNPSSIYGKSKAAGEEEMNKISPDNSIIIRTSWVYSSYGNNFVKTMIRLGSEKSTITVIDDQIGSPTYARDLATCIFELLPKLNWEGVRTHHFTNEGTVSWYDFAQAIMKLKGLTCKVLPIPTKDYPLPAPRPYYSVLDKSAIKSDFELQIPYWMDSLKECLRLL